MANANVLLASTRNAAASPPAWVRTSRSTAKRQSSPYFAWIAPATYAHLPATAAPVGRTKDGLPVGMQIVGPYLEDRTTIDVARRLTQVVGGYETPGGFA